MATPTTPQKSQPYAETAATHIRALSTLSTHLPTLLTTTATTLSQLTNSPIPLGGNNTIQDSPHLRRAALSTTANAYYTAVLQLHSALNAQIDELEKHGVVPAEEMRAKAVQVGTAAAGEEVIRRDGEESVVNGGLGGFDVGVLNARAGVGEKGRGEEVVGRVEEILKGLVEGREEDEKMTDG